MISHLSFVSRLRAASVQRRRLPRLSRYKDRRNPAILIVSGAAFARYVRQREGDVGADWGSRESKVDASALRRVHK